MQLQALCHYFGFALRVMANPYITEGHESHKRPSLHKAEPIRLPTHHKLDNHRIKTWSCNLLNKQMMVPVEYLNDKPIIVLNNMIKGNNLMAKNMAELTNNKKTCNSST